MSFSSLKYSDFFEGEKLETVTPTTVRINSDSVNEKVSLCLSNIFSIN